MANDSLCECQTRCVIAPRPGGRDALRIVRRPLPQPETGEVRIACAGMGVNRPDILQRQGRYPPPADAPEGLGLEVSGLVDAVGPGVDRWAVGDRVCALVSGGGYADYAIAHAGHVLGVPDCIPLAHAAALPETVFTVWANVFEAGRLRPGETLLVHGGASGIGTTAIQMAKAHGARVIATARSADKCAACLDLGADLAINTGTEDFVDVLKPARGKTQSPKSARDETQMPGVDVILDMVGGPFMQKNLSVLRAHGRLVNIAFAAGARVEVDFTRVMLKHLTITGSVLRSRSVDEKSRLARAVHTHVWPWLTSGQLRPLIDSTFPLDDVAQAHGRMESGEHVGKILLTP